MYSGFLCRWVLGVIGVLSVVADEVDVHGVAPRV